MAVRVLLLCVTYWCCVCGRQVALMEKVCCGSWSMKCLRYMDMQLCTPGHKLTLRDISPLYR